VRVRGNVSEEFGKYWLDLGKVVAIAGVIYPIFKEHSEPKYVASAILTFLLLLAFGLYWINRGVS